MPRTRTRAKATTASAPKEKRTRPSYNPGLQAIDRSEIPVRQYHSKAGVLVREFAESDLDAAQVVGASKHFNVRLKEFISKNQAYSHIRVVASGGDTFLEKVSENGSGTTVEDE